MKGKGFDCFGKDLEKYLQEERILHACFPDKKKDVLPAFENTEDDLEGDGEDDLEEDSEDDEDDLENDEDFGDKDF